MACAVDDDCVIFEFPLSLVCPPVDAFANDDADAADAAVAVVVAAGRARPIATAHPKRTVSLPQDEFSQCSRRITYCFCIKETKGNNFATKAPWSNLYTYK